MIVVSWGLEEAVDAMRLRQGMIQDANLERTENYDG